MICPFLSPPAEGHALVGGLVVLAVVDAVADLTLGDAPEVIARELAVHALGVVAALLVRAVAAVVLVVAPPRREDAPGEREIGMSVIILMNDIWSVFHL